MQRKVTNELLAAAGAIVMAGFFSLDPRWRKGRRRQFLSCGSM
jgi:hypothetical protein